MRWAPVLDCIAENLRPSDLVNLLVSIGYTPTERWRCKYLALHRQIDSIRDWAECSIRVGFTVVLIGVDLPLLGLHVSNSFKYPWRVEDDSCSECDRPITIWPLRLSPRLRYNKQSLDGLRWCSLSVWGIDGKVGLTLMDKKHTDFTVVPGSVGLVEIGDVAEPHSEYKTAIDGDDNWVRISNYRQPNIRVVCRCSTQLLVNQGIAVFREYQEPWNKHTCGLMVPEVFRYTPVSYSDNDNPEELADLFRGVNNTVDLQTLVYRCNDRVTFRDSARGISPSQYIERYTRDGEYDVGENHVGIGISTSPGFGSRFEILVECVDDNNSTLSRLVERVAEKVAEGDTTHVPMFDMQILREMNSLVQDGPLGITYGLSVASQDNITAYLRIPAHQKSVVKLYHVKNVLSEYSSCFV